MRAPRFTPRTPPYGDKNDAAIAHLIGEGFSCTGAAKALRSGWRQVWRRILHLGLSEQAQVNARAQRQAGFARRRAHQGTRRDWRGFLACDRADHTVSRLVRRLRSGVVDIETAFSDPALALACLHQRGLTLPEIEMCFGIPPASAVAAIQRAQT